MSATAATNGASDTVPNLQSVDLSNGDAPMSDDVTKLSAAKAFDKTEPPSDAIPDPSVARALPARLWEITLNYVPLAFVTFGGPPAHVALLHDRFVARADRRWLSEKMFAELFAIGTALPGPASTQLAYAIALIRSGVIPGIYGFLLWSVPGGIIMALLGALIGGKDSASLPQGVLFLENGLASAAVALVALAAYNLGNKLCKTHMTKVIGAIVFALTINYDQEAWLLPMCMVFGGVVAYTLHVLRGVQAARRSSRSTVHAAAAAARGADVELAAASNGAAAAAPMSNVPLSSATNTNGAAAASAAATAAAEGGEGAVMADPDIYFTYSWRAGLGVLGVWLALFVAAVLVRSYASGRAWDVLGTFFYVGSIIFGGGPVVIPLLYTYVVVSGWAESSAFLLGLAIIQTMPGPNFNFAAYCGALALRDNGVGAAVAGAALAWVGMFVPGLMLMSGVLPLWRRYRGFPLMKIIFEGVNAAAVGLVFTATYQLSQNALLIDEDGVSTGDPIPLGSNPLYTAVAGVSFVAVGFLKVPAPLMIVLGGCDYCGASADCGYAHSTVRRNIVCRWCFGGAQNSASPPPRLVEHRRRSHATCAGGGSSGSMSAGPIVLQCFTAQACESAGSFLEAGLNLRKAASVQNEYFVLQGAGGSSGLQVVLLCGNGKCASCDSSPFLYLCAGDVDVCWTRLQAADQKLPKLAQTSKPPHVPPSMPWQRVQRISAAAMVTCGYAAMLTLAVGQLHKCPQWPQHKPPSLKIVHPLANIETSCADFSAVYLPADAYVRTHDAPRRCDRRGAARRQPRRRRRRARAVVCEGGGLRIAIHARSAWTSGVPLASILPPTIDANVTAAAAAADAAGAQSLSAAVAPAAAAAALADDAHGSADLGASVRKGSKKMTAAATAGTAGNAELRGSMRKGSMMTTTSAAATAAATTSAPATATAELSASVRKGSNNASNADTSTKSADLGASTRKRSSKDSESRRESWRASRRGTPLPLFPMLSILERSGGDQEGARGAPYTPEGVSISNEHFQGRALLRLKPQQGNARQEDTRSSVFELQVQGRFLRAPEGDVYVGIEIGECMRLGLATMGLCRALLTVAQRANSRIHYSFGTKDNSELPHISFPLLTGVDDLIVTPPGEDPPALGQPWSEAAFRKKQRLAGGCDSFLFSAQNTYRQVIKNCTTCPLGSVTL
ncbi:chromate transporter-domain-containing protein [Tribonema minus]|uniref:Chromate transporter-domain-containing protein n=1 Tax=Tribonema minus TaxID=303371 RepID=A0A836CF94_9STRA|nr:chromate transporter-domain-containing protein [Tribonema minus]